MAALLVIIVILVGVSIGLFYYWREKPKELQKEIERLRKSVVSGGLDFEQIEYRISSIKETIIEKRKQLKSSNITDIDMDKYLAEMEKKLDRIISELSSGKSTK
ncbi:hypothetical protein ACFLQS_00865 [Actinomycetota bacterium]